MQMLYDLDEPDKLLDLTRKVTGDRNAQPPSRQVLCCLINLTLAEKKFLMTLSLTAAGWLVINKTIAETADLMRKNGFY